MKFRIVIPVLVCLLAGCSAKVQPMLIGNDREQKAENRQRLQAGRDVKNVTVNMAGDVGNSVIYALAGVCGLLAFGWWVAARGRKINAGAIGDIVRGVEMFKSNLKRDVLPPDEPVDWNVPKSDYASNLYGQLKMACNYHQSRKTKKIVAKVRGKKREPESRPEDSDGETDVEGEKDNSNTNSI